MRDPIKILLMQKNALPSFLFDISFPQKSSASGVFAKFLEKKRQGMHPCFFVGIQPRHAFLPAKQCRKNQLTGNVDRTGDII